MTQDKFEARRGAIAEKIRDLLEKEDATIIFRNGQLFHDETGAIRQSDASGIVILNEQFNEKQTDSETEQDANPGRELPETDEQPLRHQSKGDAGDKAV